MWEKKNIKTEKTIDSKTFNGSIHLHFQHLAPLPAKWVHGGAANCF